MGKSNRYTEYTPQDYHSLFQPVDFNEILQLGLMKERQYAQGQAESDDFLSSLYNIKSLDQDAPIRRQKLSEYESELNKTLDEAKGDYSKIFPKIGSLKRRFARDESLQDIQAKYNQDQELIKQIKDKRSDFQGQEAMVYDLYRNRPNKAYTGQQEVAPGIYNKLNYGILPVYSDISGDISKEFKTFKGLASSLGFADMGNGYFRTGTNEEVPASKVENAVKGYIIGNPKYQQQLQDMNSYYGEEYTKNYLNNLIASIQNREAGNKLDVDYHKNWMLEKEMDNQTKVSPQVMYNEESPAVDIKNKNLLNADDFVLGAGTKESSQATKEAVTSMGGWLTLDYKVKNQKDIYKNLPQEKQSTYANIANKVNSTLFDRVKSGKATEQEAKILNTEVQKALNNISNTKIGSIFQSIDPDITYPSGKKGVDGLTETVVQNLQNRKIYDPESGRTYDGRDFMEDVFNKAIKNQEKIYVPGESDGQNPYTMLTGNPAFSNSKQMFIGNKMYIVSDADNELKRTTTGNIVNLSKIAQETNQTYNLRFTPDKKEQLIINNKNFGSYEYNSQSGAYEGQIGTQSIKSDNAAQFNFLLMEAVKKEIQNAK